MVSDDTSRILLETIVDGQGKAVTRLNELTKTVLQGLGDVRTECARHAAQQSATTDILKAHVDEDRDNFKTLHKDVILLHERISKTKNQGSGTRNLIAWGSVGTAIAAGGTWLLTHIMKGG